MNVTERLNAICALPMTHVVVTRRENGTEHRHQTRSAAMAESYAIGERRSLGEPRAWRTAELLWDEPSKVVSVEIEELSA